MSFLFESKAEKICPKCGAALKDCALGWRCPICRTFVDMKGGVHLHKEKPFMPPKTHGDQVRTMTDEQLADLFVTLASRQRAAILESLREKGIIDDVCVVEMPALAKVAHLKWLREPVEDV